MQHEHPDPHPKYNWVWWGFAAIAAYFLLTEHTAHVMGALPYLLLAACPLMHIFMHHGHGHGGRHHSGDEGSHRDDGGKGDPS